MMQQIANFILVYGVEFLSVLYKCTLSFKTSERMCSFYTCTI